ncbi:unnamed protein product [Prorocentrum cordatum]|uniref:TraB domain-containing protein n=1 Tax=Prorocentrum cordatum TaxID=2364126 RepID=A0ABN9QJP8_9DINO|nr:unnamed protein product [Polarella glacialis]
MPPSTSISLFACQQESVRRRVRALQKKLREIEKLKCASEGLDQLQREKLASEDEVRRACVALERELDMLERPPSMVFEVETERGVRRCPTFLVSLIEFRDGDGLEELALRFCDEHGLEDDLVDPLVQHMEQRKPATAKANSAQLVATALFRLRSAEGGCYHARDHAQCCLYGDGWPDEYSNSREFGSGHVCELTCRGGRQRVELAPPPPRAAATRDAESRGPQPFFLSPFTAPSSPRGTVLTSSPDPRPLPADPAMARSASLLLACAVAAAAALFVGALALSFVGASPESGNPTRQPVAFYLNAAADAVLDSARELGAGALRAALQILYRYVEDYLGTSAGEEMVAAMRSAAQIGVPVLLGDLPSKVTFKRISQEVGSADMQKLEEEVSMAAPELRMGALDTKADLQALLEGGRDQATTRRIRKAFKNSAPGLFSALVDERDEYMARNLLTGLRAGRRRIVAVVGSIHVPGIEERLVRLGGLRAVDACVSA